MVDDFDGYGSSLDSPGTNAESVVPNDDSDLSRVSRALWIGVAGNVKLTTLGGDTVVFVGAQGWMPLRVSRIHSDETTASAIISVW